MRRKHNDRQILGRKSKSKKDGTLMGDGSVNTHGTQTPKEWRTIGDESGLEPYEANLIMQGLLSNVTHTNNLKEGVEDSSKFLNTYVNYINNWTVSC